MRKEKKVTDYYCFLIFGRSWCTFFSVVNMIQTVPYSFVYMCMPKITCTPHKAVAELGIFCMIFAFFSWVVVLNVELT